MNKEEIKLCPFCGGEAEIRKYGFGHGGNGEFKASYQVGCNKCKIYFKFESIFKLENGQPEFIINGYDECIKAWNRRVGNGS